MCKKKCKEIFKWFINKLVFSESVCRLKSWLWQLFSTVTHLQREINLSFRLHNQRIFVFMWIGSSKSWHIKFSVDIFLMSIMASSLYAEFCFMFVACFCTRRTRLHKACLVSFFYFTKAQRFVAILSAHKCAHKRSPFQILHEPNNGIF